MSGLKSGRSRISAAQPRLCQDCSQAAEQHPTHVGNSGISAQPTTGDGRPWTTCPLLRIRRLGVRVPPSALLFSQAKRTSHFSRCPYGSSVVVMLAWPRISCSSLGG
jgi:hypothetical protein